MDPIVLENSAVRHLERLENVRPSMAKADLKKVETAWRERIGRAIHRAFSLAGLTQKEAARLLERDQAQVARWVSGAERAQLDALFAVEAFRHSLVLALAELAGNGIEIETTIRIRRSA